MAQRHGRTNFFIAHEGIFESHHVGRDGKPKPRRPTSIEEIRKFRFSRLFPEPSRQPSTELVEKLATAMVVPDRTKPDSNIPAGFTYLGQFIDHDLTLDKTGKALGTDVTVEELLQGRSPSLDL